ncbi:MAG: ABC transporter permease [Bacteroidota bacterium]
MKIDRDTVDFEVTGVIENFPGNSHLQFPVIASFMGSWGDKNETWGNASFETFILVHENIDPATLDKKIAETIERVIPDKESRWFTLETHALKDIHLQYADTQDFSGAARGDMGQLNILIGLGCIILLIAAVNYMNLATAQSQRRYKEIGINKALGATSQQMARKFYLEDQRFCRNVIGAEHCPRHFSAAHL